MSDYFKCHYCHTHWKSDVAEIYCDCGFPYEQFGWGYQVINMDLQAVKVPEYNYKLIQELERCLTK